MPVRTIPITMALSALLALVGLVLVQAETEYRRPPSSPQLPLDQLQCASPTQPEQIRLTHTAGGLRVTWISQLPHWEASQSSVRFGTSMTGMDQQGTQPTSRVSSCSCHYCGGNYTSGLILTSLLAPLLPSTTYYYQIAGQPHPNSFITAPAADLHPFTFALIGDLGQTSNSNSTVSHLAQSAAGLILHVGDLSYADGLQQRWDSYGRLVERLSSRVPWMTCAGNHEIEDRNSNGCGGGTFGAYSDRYGHAMPFNESGSSSFQYYSIEVAGAHVMMLGSYTKDSVNKQLYSEQLKWVKQDLATVNRTRTPWLFAVLHAPWYNSNKAHQNEAVEYEMVKTYEQILYDAKLDAMFAGHVHAYERSHRVFQGAVDKCGATYINIGDGGNREGLASKYLSQPATSAFREASFGHGELEVVNQTHSHFTWHRDQDDERIISDDVWLVKDPSC